MATTVKVELDSRSYPIHIGAGIVRDLGKHCAEIKCGRKALIVSDDRVYPLMGATVHQSLTEAGFSTFHHVVPAGESSKSHKQLTGIYDAALKAGLERSSLIVALGGGVIGDLAGFAAATFLRGIHLVQVPTTLLAMVDSAVGGKTGINVPQGKNLIGAFHQPSLVLADTAALHTLPLREFCSGLAEVIKYGVIRDPGLFDLLEPKLPDEVISDDRLLQELVERSCRIKADVVSCDEREGGLRAILNFGHTMGHAIEQVSGYRHYLHGEAIAIGMVYAARLSVRLKGFPNRDSRRLANLLTHHHLPVDMPDLQWSELLKAIMHDKKRTDGVVGFVLAERLGTVQFGCPVERRILEEVWYEGAE